MSSLLDRPEYVHAAINHFPLIGLFTGLFSLVIGLVTRSRPVLFTSLGLVCLMSLSVWPVFYFGDAGFDRVLSMSDEPGEAFLKYHAHLAHHWVFIYYISAAVAGLGFGLSWKWPRVLVPACAVALLLGIISLSAGIIIAQAGGEVRHREFRMGPPPKVTEDHDSH